MAWARDTTDFRPDVAKRGRRCLREPAHGLRAWPRAIARRGRAFIAPQDFGPLGRCTQIGVGARHDRFSTIDERHIFNKWDVCTLGKCRMDVRRMVCRVAYAANVLPELEALIKSEHKPVVGRTTAGKAAKRKVTQMLAVVVPDTQKTKKKVRVRVVHCNASVHCAVKWQLQRNSDLYSTVRLTPKKGPKLPLRIGLPFKAQHAADVARTQGKKAAHDATDWGELAMKLGPVPMVGGSMTGEPKPGTG